MPSNNRFMDAIAAAAGATPGLDSFRQAMACNLALGRIWRAYDWRESIAELPPFNLVPGRQDYGAPWVYVPDDFLGLRKAYHWNYSSGSAGARPTEMNVVRDLASAQVTSLGAPMRIDESICYHEPLQCFRILPVPASNMAAPYHVVDGKYKTVPKVTLASDNTVVNRITASNIANAILPFDDLYFEVWVQAVKWALMTLAHSPGTTAAQIQGTSAYTGGQEAVMESAIRQMARNENLELANRQQFPREVLATPGFGGW